MELKKLIYRRPRYRMDVPVLLHLSKSSPIPGRCLNLSSEGIGVKLSGETAISEEVQVEFVLSGQSLFARARVEYRCDGNYYGLRFQWASQTERDGVARMLAAVQRIT